MTFFETIGKIIERYSSFFAQGVVNTLIIAAFSVLLGTILGTLMATMRMGKILPLKWLAVAYIEFIRGTPLMVQLMFIFYGLPMIGVKIPEISWIPNFSRFAAGIVAMSMNSCAYVAEVIRSGIQSVDAGQSEAAMSLGMNSFQRTWYILVPQALKTILPALGNEFIMIVKDTSLASTFFIGDLMTQYLIVRGASYLPLEPLVIVGVIYFILTFLLSKLFGFFERRMSRADR